MSEKLQALQALLQVHPEGLSDDDRTYWAQRYAQLEQAAKTPSKTSTAAENSKQGKKQGTVSMSAVHAVLWVLTVAAHNGSLRVDQSIGQLMAKTALGEGTVKRVLSLLDRCELVPVLSRGGGPTNRSKGRKTPQATVRWLKFAADHEQRAQAAAGPVDEAITQTTEAITRATPSITQATSGPHYNTTTTPLPTAHVATEVQAPTAQAAGGNEAREARAPRDLWAEQLARAAADHWLSSDEFAGKVKPRDRQALIDKRLPACRDKVHSELLKFYPQARSMVNPGHYLWGEMVTAIACLANGEGLSPATWDGLRRYLEAGNQRAAMGAAG